MNEIKIAKTKEDIIKIAKKYNIQLEKPTKKDLKEKLKKIKTKNATIILQHHCIYKGEAVLKGDDGLFYTAKGDMHYEYMSSVDHIYK